MKKSYFFAPFNITMTFIFALILSIPAFAQSTQFDMNCSNGQCVSVDLTNSLNSCSVKNNKALCEEKVSGNLCSWIDDTNVNGGYCTSLPQEANCTGFDCPAGATISVVKMRGIMQKDLNVVSNSGTPQNLALSINNGYPGKNANISVAAKSSAAKGASLILIGDNFNSLNINLDGYTGKKGKSVSEICAAKIKNGDYGLPLQNYFNDRRSASPNANPDKCDGEDLNHMQAMNFKCDDDAYQEVPVTNPVVPVSQIKKQARCQATATYSYCVSKKVIITCEFRLWSSYRQAYITTGDYLAAESKNGNVPSMFTKRSRTLAEVDESIYNSESLRLGGPAGYCQLYGQAPKNGPDANDFWGGVAGLSQSKDGSGKESQGIPTEYISGPVVVANWPQETSSPTNGGYSPYAPAGTNYYTKAAYWKATGATVELTSPGLNPDGITAAPGSSWQVIRSNTFDACPAGWEPLKTFSNIIYQYTNKENVTCLGINDPQDPNNRAKWSYQGIAQEVSFGTETVSCGIGSCAVNSSTSEVTHSLDRITPESGEDGSEQGRGLVFIYDAENIDAHALPGGAGTVGAMDVNVNSQTRICAKTDDATAGINTAQAKNPFVSFRRYDWKVIRSEAGGNAGIGSPNTGKSVEVFKKLDPAVRYLLEKTLLP